jgi:hypothetical protein
LFERPIFHYVEYLLRKNPCDCAGGGFCSATREMIGTPPFEIGWSRFREAAADGRVLPYIECCPIYIGTKRVRLCAAAQPARNRGGKGLALKVLTGDTVQFFNRVWRQLQARAGYILSQMLNR